MRTRRGRWSLPSVTPTTNTGPRHGQAGASSHVPERRKSSSPGGQLVYTVYVKDQLTGGRLLVDTVSSFSIS
jgi:hypothetical protein